MFFFLIERILLAIRKILFQPKVVGDTINSVVKENFIDLTDIGLSEEDIKKISQIYIVACGSAYHVGIAAQYVIEDLAKIPVRVELGSEFRYRKPLLDKNGLVVVISQSGETADSLAALREAKEKGVRTLGIVNVVGSSIAREADSVFYTLAGPEIAVATTKAYSTQLVATYAYEEADSLRSLADELNISLLKLRKLLITADVFTSDICTEINDLHQSGKKIPEIMKLTGLSRASVHSYLPYTKGIYNAAEISLNAERCRTYKNRQEQVRFLQEIPSEENLWQAVIAFQDYPFKTATGLPFRYKLKVGKNGEYNRELLIDRREKSKSLAWSSVVLAFENSKRISEEVKKPKALGDIRGVSYIYPILWRFGLIRVPEAIERKMRKQR